MRKNLRLLLCLVALGITFVPAQMNVAQQGLPRVGGFKEVATDDAQVVAAARFAVRTQAQKQKTRMKLLSIHSAERQTVQGANYRLCLVVEIEDTENNVVVDQGVKVLVYQNLKREFSLGKNSWTEENCNEEEDEQQ
ncbi:MAG TPA: cystatin domain-containing protein [Pyrinomonadaceae bacterium]|jgi:hypothetical protein|nr:cystatin domain-containing protein [Pyrinomonadaceae bacterium]